MDPAQTSSNNSVNSNHGDGIAELEPKVSDKGNTNERTAPLLSHCREIPIEEDLARYWSLRRAIYKNDWKAVDDFVTENPEVLTARISERSRTIFHQLSGKGNAIFLQEKLVSQVSLEFLEQARDDNGDSPLILAAALGDAKFSEILIRKSKNLLYMRNKDSYLPVHEAARFGREEIVRYLLSVTDVPIDTGDDFKLLKYLIDYNLYGIAYDLLKRYPELARHRNEHWKNILTVLARKPMAFASGSQLGYWQRLIYRSIPLPEEHDSYHPVNEKGDMENPVEKSQNWWLTKFGPLGCLGRIVAAIDDLSRKLYIVLWNAITVIVPGIKRLRDEKLMHMQTLGIVRMMFDGVDDNFITISEAASLFEMPMLTAARFGIYEIVNEIMDGYFNSHLFHSEFGDTFQTAVRFRQAKVFNLVHKFITVIQSYLPDMDERLDNILHSAARLAPSSQVPGAALQMQRELQWFKAVESIYHPSHQEHRNADDKTPWEVFTDEHKQLVKDGEKWMKDTAESCTVVVSLIITVVFAAAFTVPGGNDTQGKPIFLREIPFIIFAVSDAVALFSSTTSLLIFLGILTSRYSQEDFLESLPKKLIMGLITLFVSIASMMVAFAATISITLSRPWKWVIIPVSLLGCLPVTLFARMQFPLLLEMFSSTYGPSIFEPTKIWSSNTGTNSSTRSFSLMAMIKFNEEEHYTLVLFIKHCGDKLKDKARE